MTLGLSGMAEWPLVLEPRCEDSAGQTLPLLNLGCGRRWHPRWVNLDLRPRSPRVGQHDCTTTRLPFPDGCFAGLYHAHLLEHIPRDLAFGFLQECRRVLRAGGVLRVVVPDLEQIAQLYLDSVRHATRAQDQARERHAWMTLELLDQLTRERPGGHMARFVRQRLGSDIVFQERLGTDAGYLAQEVSPLMQDARQDRWTRRWRARLAGWLFGSWRERLLRWLCGREYALLQIGRFRRGGEVHHWMYDRVSLGRLLVDAGFDAPAVRGPTESLIPGWPAFHLDTLPDGKIAKPDSLYMEAVKG